MWQPIIENWPWLVKIGSAITTIFLYSTGYPLLLIERRKNKALVETNQQMEAQNRQLEEIILQARRLAASTDSSTGSDGSFPMSIKTPMSSPPGERSNAAPTSRTN